ENRVKLGECGLTGCRDCWSENCRRKAMKHGLHRYVEFIAASVACALPEFPGFAVVGRGEDGAAPAGAGTSGSGGYGAACVVAIKPGGGPVVVVEAEVAVLVDGQPVIKNAVIRERRGDENLRFFPISVGRFALVGERGPE